MVVDKLIFVNDTKVPNLEREILLLRMVLLLKIKGIYIMLILIELVQMMEHKIIQIFN